MNAGGATGIPSWGKTWLSILGCYEWEGVGPVPPELWYVASSRIAPLIALADVAGSYPIGYRLHRGDGYVFARFPNLYLGPVET